MLYHNAEFSIEWRLNEHSFAKNHLNHVAKPHKKALKYSRVSSFIMNQHDNLMPLINSTIERLTLIVCQNSQGVKAQKTLYPLKRYLNIFVIYINYFIIQISTVLHNFRTIINERFIYQGGHLPLIVGLGTYKGTECIPCSSRF